MQFGGKTDQIIDVIQDGAFLPDEGIVDLVLVRVLIKDLFWLGPGVSTAVGRVILVILLKVILQILLLLAEELRFLYLFHGKF